ncbi:preprotein translocase subunit YajC [Larsenimonas rhizosphaerae]|uniref:Sec translocon accessory complex subunit YajC n=1 Tax=Larsenimonas rhizosphaerae TaxID=2944682 RepID=A0AA42CV20_9GAMM|nr:preprotein translocase subunit YajC [Larsenimonas rhizosphaerae]MCM2129910.1 preprotein translocase subunit YajC [Larsenimonas rhizosphaerae]MCX2524571.1 preprotein translocase subunit YajC [Larsenimonas rhizosphaerae]
MLDYLISTAQAADGGAGAGGAGAIGQIVMLVGFVLIFYFLLWRPQSKRAKQHKKLITELSKGDEIVIGGGMVGRVNKVGEEFLTLEVSEGVEVNVQKNAVAAVLPKGTLKSL